MRSAPAVKSGLDVLLRDEQKLATLRRQRVGLLGHAASVSADFEHAIDALIGAGVRLERLFGPEHGLRGEAQMMVGVQSAVDPLSGVPVVSLYGDTVESLAPETGALDGLDVLLIDVQDVGSRYYTYVATALKLCRAATAVDLPVIVLDRPNPIGRRREGPSVDLGFHSFVGELAVPTRHGLSVAELFEWAKRAGWAIHFETIACEGWDPTQALREKDFTWALPSPNMPTLETALVYPGGCLLEATNISEGRGTTRPFEIVGAPWIDARRWKASLDACELPGVAFRLASFIPTFDKFTGEACRGLQVHVTDSTRFEPLVTYAAMITRAAAQHPQDFGWRPGAYEFVEEIPAMDLLAGSDRLRALIEAGAPIDELQAWAQTPSALEESCREVERYA